MLKQLDEAYRGPLVDAGYHEGASAIPAAYFQEPEVQSDFRRVLQAAHRCLPDRVVAMDLAFRRRLVIARAVLGSSPGQMAENFSWWPDDTQVLDAARAYLWRAITCRPCFVGVDVGKICRDPWLCSSCFYRLVYCRDRRLIAATKAMHPSLVLVPLGSGRMVEDLSGRIHASTFDELRQGAASRLKAIKAMNRSLRGAAWIAGTRLAPSKFHQESLAFDFDYYRIDFYSKRCRPPKFRRRAIRPLEHQDEMPSKIYRFIPSRHWEMLMLKAIFRAVLPFKTRRYSDGGRLLVKQQAK